MLKTELILYAITSKYNNENLFILVNKSDYKIMKTDFINIRTGPVTFIAGLPMIISNDVKEGYFYVLDVPEFELIHAINNEYKYSDVLAEFQSTQ